MLKHIYLVFFSTFVLGLILGVVLFLNNVGPGGGSIDDPSSGYVIAAYTYGGCERLGCPLYRITQTGEYIFIPAGASEGIRYTGTLPLAERRALADELKKANLEEVSQTVFSGECAVYVDGVGYRYDITYRDARYSFDSCAQETEGILLFHLLAEYFDRFGQHHANE